MSIWTKLGGGLKDFGLGASLGTNNLAGMIERNKARETAQGERAEDRAFRREQFDTNEAQQASQQAQQSVRRLIETKSFAPAREAINANREVLGEAAVGQLDQELQAAQQGQTRGRVEGLDAFTAAARKATTSTDPDLMRQQAAGIEGETEQFLSSRRRKGPLTPEESTALQRSADTQLELERLEKDLRSNQQIATALQNVRGRVPTQKERDQLVTSLSRGGVDKTAARIVAQNVVAAGQREVMQDAEALAAGSTREGLLLAAQRVQSIDPALADVYLARAEGESLSSPQAREAAAILNQRGVSDVDRERAAELFEEAGLEDLGNAVRRTRSADEMTPREREDLVRNMSIRIIDAAQGGLPWQFTNKDGTKTTLDTWESAQAWVRGTVLGQAGASAANSVPAWIDRFNKTLENPEVPPDLKTLQEVRAVMLRSSSLSEADQQRVIESISKDHPEIAGGQTGGASGSFEEPRGATGSFDKTIEDKLFDDPRSGFSLKGISLFPRIPLNQMDRVKRTQLQTQLDAAGISREQQQQMTLQEAQAAIGGRSTVPTARTSTATLRALGG